MSWHDPSKFSHFEVARGVIDTSVENFLKNRNRWYVDIFGPMEPGTYVSDRDDMVQRHYSNRPFEPIVQWSSGICGKVRYDGFGIFDYDFKTIFRYDWKNGPIYVDWGEGATVDVTHLSIGTFNIADLLRLEKGNLRRTIDDPWEISKR